jgi:hypothetical protein
MGFNKRFLPEVKELEKIRESMKSDSKFIRFFLQDPDAVIGSEDSLNYMRELEKKLNSTEPKP